MFLLHKPDDLIPESFKESAIEAYTGNSNTIETGIQVEL